MVYPLLFLLERLLLFVIVYIDQLISDRCVFAVSFVAFGQLRVGFSAIFGEGLSGILNCVRLQHCWIAFVYLCVFFLYFQDV